MATGSALCPMLCMYNSLIIGFLADCGDCLVLNDACNYGVRLPNNDWVPRCHYIGVYIRGGVLSAFSSWMVAR